MFRRPSRALLWGTAVALGLLGAFFNLVLVADRGDNAYAYLLVVGSALMLGALPFVAAALAPVGSVRRVVTRVALVFLALVGLLGLALMVLSVLIIPSQNYTSNTVLINHIIALLALIVVSGSLVVLHRRRGAEAITLGPPPFFPVACMGCGQPISRASEACNYCKTPTKDSLEAEHAAPHTPRIEQP